MVEQMFGSETTLVRTKTQGSSHSLPSFLIRSESALYFHRLVSYLNLASIASLSAFPYSDLEID